jgi:hypothetical protein
MAIGMYGEIDDERARGCVMTREVCNVCYRLRIYAMAHVSHVLILSRLMG